MKGKTLGDKLYERRQLHGHSQFYLGVKLNMTQAAISWIENGKTKFTGDLVERFKAIEGYEDFDIDKPETVDSLDALPAKINGRWGIDFLTLIVLVACLTVPVVCILYFDFIFDRAEDAARGYGTVNGPEYPSMVFIFAFIFMVLNALAVYGIYRIIKWWRKRYGNDCN